MNVWLQLAEQCLRRALSAPALWSWLARLIDEAEHLDAPLTGEQKRAYVLRRVVLRDPPQPDWLINLAMEILVARRRTRTEPTS